MNVESHEIEYSLWRAKANLAGGRPREGRLSEVKESVGEGVVRVRWRLFGVGISQCHWKAYFLNVVKEKSGSSSHSAIF